MSVEPTGLRERKRQQTARRITETALRLFASQGYEATTLDTIAAEAGISRRTFFHYFKSKDDILLSQEAGLGEQLLAALALAPDAETPFATVRQVMRAIASSYSLEEMVALDKMMMSIEAVQQRKQASYIRDEALVYDALCHRWKKADRLYLRLVAQMAIGLTRLSLDTWRADGSRRPIVEYLDRAFAALPHLA